MPPKKAGSGSSNSYEYDAGENSNRKMSRWVDYCGICHSDHPVIDNEWGFSSIPS